MSSGRLSVKSQGPSLKLDLRDKKILSFLSENSRMPTSTIAKKLGINRDTVTYKIKRLEKEGVLKKYYPEFDIAPLGFSQYHFFFITDEQYAEKRLELIEVLKNHPHTRSVITYHDRWNIQWVFIAKDLLEVDEISTEVMTQFSDIIIEGEELIVTRQFYTTKLPYNYYLEADKHIPDLVPPKRDVVTDNIDIEILKILSDDARENAVNIGKQVGLSSDAVIKRIKRMYNEKIISRYTAVVDLNKLGYDWYTFVVKMKYFDEKHHAALQEYVKEHKNIIKCLQIFGTWDMLMYVAAPNPTEFHEVITDIKKNFMHVIHKYETWIAHKEHVFCNVPKIAFEKKNN